MGDSNPILLFIYYNYNSVVDDSLQLVILVNDDNGKKK